MSLANLVLLREDEELLALAARHGLRYTRFVDDLVFSGPDPRPIIQPVIEILGSAGFGVSRSKIKIMSRGRRQEVTGLTVNRSDRVTKGGGYRDKIRLAILELRSVRSEPHLFATTLGSIRGRLEHLRTINPKAAASLDRKLAEVVVDQPTSQGLPQKRRKRTARGVSIEQWRRRSVG